MKFGSRLCNVVTFLLVCSNCSIQLQDGGGNCYPPVFHVPVIGGERLSPGQGSWKFCLHTQVGSGLSSGGQGRGQESEQNARVIRDCSNECVKKPECVTFTADGQGCHVTTYCPQTFSPINLVLYDMTNTTTPCGHAQYLESPNITYEETFFL